MVVVDGAGTLDGKGKRMTVKVAKPLMSNVEVAQWEAEVVEYMLTLDAMERKADDEYLG